MTKIISIIVYKLIELSDKFFYLLTKKNFKLYLIDLLEKESYKKINILGKKIYFFVPNALVNTRVNNIFTDYKIIFFVAFILEILHFIVPNRAFEYYDLLANMFGVIIVLLLKKIIK